ncbi:hypothetical protein FQN54_004271 [Arachnomyces sp. PD_36]|nr:hypothetical protein FQN54_004271 [Arachnomyces sp. PD_36]
MSGPHGSSSQARLGATFYPGGVDDFYMPEVISPAPQRPFPIAFTPLTIYRRVMPEVPEHMQSNIAHLEQEAHGPNRMQSQHAQYGQPSPGGGYGNLHTPQVAQYDSVQSSPFPVLQNPPPNVPPTHEQREANLESGRVAVLSSNDPEMQLAWAQDTLAHVEVALQNELREALVQPPRPQTPAVERQLRTDATNVVAFLADQRHPKAEFIKGMWLEFGKFGYRIDKKEAFRCYSRAAEKGYARAEYRMGMQFESSNEPLKAIKHYEKGVALGDSASHYRLGMMILLGQHGQRQDYQVGLEHIQYAAKTCDENAPQGAYVYGMLLARELPQVSIPENYLPIDLNNSRINIEKAAYHGFAKAQVKMGAAYELCQLGCDFNPALSLHYNALAARQGEPEAEMAISKWFLCGHEGVFEKNDEMAFTYAKRAAQGGLPTAEFAMGYFYEIGICVPVDIKEARVWYAKAASSGNKDATSRIDSISRSKTLSRKDHEKVAIARIKSQYASHGRNSLASVQEGVQPVQDTIEMPDPSRMRISNGDPTGRSASAAPYPDGSQSAAPRLGGPNHYKPDVRSSSAFGINPNLRSSSAATYGNAPPPRVSSSAQGYHPQGSDMNSPMGPGGNMPPGGPNKLDIGFSAPPDPSGADRRRRRPEQMPMSGRPPTSSGMGQRSPGYAPQQQGAPMSPRQSSHGSSTAPPAGGQFPPRMESMQQPSRSPMSTPKPGALPAAQTAPADMKSSAGKPAKSSAGGLPGKGPKTFEEMGVPQGKTEGDCVVM